MGAVTVYHLHLVVYSPISSRLTTKLDTEEDGKLLANNYDKKGVFAKDSIVDKKTFPS